VPAAMAMLLEWCNSRLLNIDDDDES